MVLQTAIIQQLSSKGILAYVAVSLNGDFLTSTAALADLVKCQTGAMREGLKELAVVAPEVVRPAGKKWQCGTAKDGLVVESPNLDSARYPALVDDLMKYWTFLNPELPFSISGADGAAIRQFLRDHPEWLQVHWQTALQHRARSVAKFGHGTRTEDFYRWVRRLGDYAAGPLNSYNKPVEGSGNAGKTIDIRNNNRAAVQRAIANAGEPTANSSCRGVPV